MMFGPSLVGWRMQVHLGEMMQSEDADHADDNRGQHDFRDGPILEQQLADQHVELCHAAFLKKESRRPDRRSRRRAAGRLWRLWLFGRFFTALPGSIIAVERKGGGDAADEKTDNRDPRADVELHVPLMPCPLVQPPAKRAPKAIRIPPKSRSSARSNRLSPKRATHIGGTHSLTNSPPVQAAMKPPIIVQDKDQLQPTRGGFFW